MSNNTLPLPGWSFLYNCIGQYITGRKIDLSLQIPNNWGVDLYTHVLQALRLYMGKFSTCRVCIFIY